MSASPGRPPSDEWLARAPAWGHARHPEETRDPAAGARFFVLRKRFLWHLRRDHRMWRLQGRNILWGLARLGLFLGLAPPILACWEPAEWPAVVGGGCLGLLLGQRLSGCRNVFVDTAERMAWAVVATETPPGEAAETDTQREPGA